VLFWSFIARRLEFVVLSRFDFSVKDDSQLGIRPLKLFYFVTEEGYAVDLIYLN